MAILKALRVGDNLELKPAGARWLKIPGHKASMKFSGVILESQDGTDYWYWPTDAGVLYFKNAEPSSTETDGTAVGGAAATDAQLLAVAASTPSANTYLLWSAVGTCAATSITSNAQSILAAADYSAMRTLLTLRPGTEVQAYNAGLTNLAGISMQADRFYYTSSDDTHVAGTVTAAARTVLDDASVGAMLTTMGGATLGSNADITALTVLTGEVKTPTNIIMTGSIATPTTITASSHITTAGNIIIDSNSSKLQLGDTPASNAAIYYDGTSLQFEDDDGGVTYTLKELATGTSLNPTVNGDLSIPNGNFTWSNAGTAESATWDLDATTADGIDMIFDVIDLNAIHVIANSLTTGTVLNIATDSIDAAGALIQLGITAGSHNGTGNFIQCQGGAGDLFEVGQYGKVTIAGNAKGADAIAITAGDITLTDGDCTLTDGDYVITKGKVVVATITDETTSITRTLSGASTPVVKFATADAGDQGLVLDIDQIATGAYGAVRILSDGDGAILALASSGTARTGDAFDIDLADFLGERGILVHGAHTGTVDQGVIEVAGSGVLAAGANLLRLSSSASNAQHSFIAEIAMTAGTLVGATDGFCLQIDDDSVETATSYAVNIDSANNQALRITAGEALFDEKLTISAGGIDVTDISALAHVTATVANSGGVDAIVIDQNDVTGNKDGLVITTDGTGYAIKATVESTTGKGIYFLAAANQTTSLLTVDGTTNDWKGGADDVGMIQVSSDLQTDDAGGTLLHITNSAQPIASAEGSIARFLQTGTAVVDSYAVEIASAATGGALNVSGGVSLFAEKATFTAGAQSSAVARQAQAAPGGGNGVIAAGTSMVTVTVATDANDVITLPAPVPGNVIWLLSGAIAFELRSSTTASISINGGTDTNAESRIDATDLLTRCVCVDSTTWIVTNFIANGTEAPAEVAAD